MTLAPLNVVSLVLMVAPERMILVTLNVGTRVPPLAQTRMTQAFAPMDRPHQAPVRPSCLLLALVSALIYDSFQLLPQPQ